LTSPARRRGALRRASSTPRRLTTPARSGSCWGTHSTRRVAAVGKTNERRAARVIRQALRRGPDKERCPPTRHAVRRLAASWRVRPPILRLEAAIALRRGV
jgi:hypothetical protein